MPYWDHKREITQFVFMMDWVFSFYVKTPPQVPAKGFSGFLDSIWNILPPVHRKPCMGSKWTQKCH